MSTGYDQVNEADFNNYFAGGMAFRYHPATGRVMAYKIMMIENEEGDLRGLASENSVRVRDSSGNYSSVDVDDLFNSNEWVIHRWPIQYITRDDQTLLAIGMEPRDRRMSKSLNIGHLSFSGVMSTFANHMPPDISTALGRGPNNSDLRSPQGIDKALAKVLSYGHHPYFSQISQEVPKGKRWARNAKQEVTDILSGTSDAKVVVPESYTALIKHASEPKMYVVHHGAFIGELMMEDDKLVLVSKHGQEYSEGTERSLVLEGLAQLGYRLFDCEVINK